MDVDGKEGRMKIEKMKQTSREGGTEEGGEERREIGGEEMNKETAVGGV